MAVNELVVGGGAGSCFAAPTLIRLVLSFGEACGLTGFSGIPLSGPSLSGAGATCADLLTGGGSSLLRGAGLVLGVCCWGRFAVLCANPARRIPCISTFAGAGGVVGAG